MTTSSSPSFASVIIMLITTTSFCSQSLWCVFGVYSLVITATWLFSRWWRMSAKKRKGFAVCLAICSVYWCSEGYSEGYKEKSRQQKGGSHRQIDGQVIRQEESRRKESSVEQKENALTLPTSCGLISASQLVLGRWMASCHEQTHGNPTGSRLMKVIFDFFT